jgi:NCS1 family nucleobase:cation symporter-1
MYRIAAAVNISAWTLGSANLANGLSPGETIGMVFIGSVLAGLISFLCGEPGVSLPNSTPAISSNLLTVLQVKYHVGFPMMSRAGFGMYGSYFVVMLKCFVNFI